MNRPLGPKHLLLQTKVECISHNEEVISSVPQLLSSVCCFIPIVALVLAPCPAFSSFKLDNTVARRMCYESGTGFVSRSY
jgi:hypothetical protein